MKLSSFKRLNKADFEEKFHDLIDILSVSLNNGIEALYDAMNRKISLADNIFCDVKDITLQVNASGIPTQTTTFTINKDITALKGLTVIRADNTSSTSVFPSGGIFITYTQTSTSAVQIRHVAGLPAGYQFSLRIIAWG